MTVSNANQWRRKMTDYDAPLDNRTVTGDELVEDGAIPAAARAIVHASGPVGSPWENSKLVVYQVPNLEVPHHYAKMVRLWRGAALSKKLNLGVSRPARLSNVKLIALFGV